MKYSTVFVSLLQASLVYCGTRPSFVSDRMIDYAASGVNACQKQTHVSTADIEAVRNEQWPESQPLKVSEDISRKKVYTSCYMYCLWQQFGLLDHKRELSLGGMLTFFQRIPAYREEVQRAIFECKAIANGDDCQYAYTFNKCYAKLSPNTYYLF